VLSPVTSVTSVVGLGAGGSTRKDVVKRTVDPAKGLRHSEANKLPILHRQPNAPLWLPML